MKPESIMSFEDLCNDLASRVVEHHPLVVYVCCDFVLESGEAPRIIVTRQSESDAAGGRIVLFLAKMLLKILGTIKGMPGMDAVLGKTLIAQCKVPQDWAAELKAQADQMESAIKSKASVVYLSIDKKIEEISFVIRLQSASLRYFVERQKPSQDDNIPGLVHG